MACDISYIIAAYNAEATIGRAINSVLAQTDADVEVVVADDCSTDETSRVVCGYQTDKIKLVSLPENGGPGSARNRAIAAATGKWIGIIDADDEILPSRSSRLLKRGENADAIIDNLLIKSTIGERLLHQTTNFVNLGRLDLAYFIEQNMLFSGRFNLGYLKPLVRREFLLREGIAYDERLRIGEDYLFLARILSRGGVCLVEPEAGYVYYSAEGSISHRMTCGDIEAMLAADADFEVEGQMNASARAAQQRRTGNLKEALAFLRLVDHIKQRDLWQIARSVLRNPSAARHLKMPVAIRLKAMMTMLQAPISTLTGI